MKQAASNEYSISKIDTLGTRGFESLNSLSRPVSTSQEIDSNFLYRKPILIYKIIANQIQVDKINHKITVLT